MEAEAEEEVVVVGWTPLSDPLRECQFSVLDDTVEEEEEVADDSTVEGGAGAGGLPW